jgi:spore germination protein GerM
MSKNNHYLSLSEASKQTGKSKSVLSKALNNGILSYVEKNDAGYKIDPAELFRIFPIKNKNSVQEAEKEQFRTHNGNIENLLKIKELVLRLEAMEREKDFYRQQCDKVETEKEDWKKQAQTLLLKAPEKLVERRKGFLGRLIG